MCLRSSAGANVQVTDWCLYHECASKFGFDKASKNRHEPNHAVSCHVRICTTGEKKPKAHASIICLHLCRHELREQEKAACGSATITDINWYVIDQGMIDRWLWAYSGGLCSSPKRSPLRDSLSHCVACFSGCTVPEVRCKRRSTRAIRRIHRDALSRVHASV
jgi:hypothetical protein